MSTNILTEYIGTSFWNALYVLLAHQFCLTVSLLSFDSLKTLFFLRDLGSASQRFTILEAFNYKCLHANNTIQTVSDSYRLLYMYMLTPHHMISYCKERV